MPYAGHLDAGTLIGNYRIGERIGAGGMGVVYKAVDNSLRRTVAIKILRTDPRAPAPEGSLVTEARAVASLEHERFVRVYALDVLPSGQPYMVMEYLEGKTLRAWLADSPSRSAVVMACYAICEGIAFAHRRGIVHRDLKPENVFLTNEGKLKILDLGLAGLSEPPRSSSIERAQLPRLSASCAGTPLYIAPEIWRGATPTPQADIWALGVILYEALSGGQHPFWIQGEPHTINVQRVLNHAYRPLSQVAAGVPGALDQIVRRALARNLATRFVDADELLEALRGYMRAADIPLPSSALPFHSEFEGARRSVMHRLRLGLMIGSAGLVLLAAISAQRGSLWQTPRRLASASLPLTGMAAFPGGSFTMGSTRSELRAAQAWCEQESGDPRLCPLAAVEQEQPARRVTISPFYLDRTEVTNDEFAAWLNECLHKSRIRTTETGRLVIARDADEAVLADLYPSYLPNYGLLYKSEERRFVSYPGFAARPVTQVTWAGAHRFCQDHGKRLPTEAEWEYAARGGGHEEFRFPWGNEQPRCDGVVAARSEKRVSASEQGPERLVHMRCAHMGMGPAPVAVSLQDVSPQGVYDLAGNVSEWVQDPFVERYLACGSCRDPVVSEERSAAALHHRVFRGGSWALLLAHTRAATRSDYDEYDSSSSIGFRCAKSQR
ncbi:MAG: bifunctional serine/threonine-protein kinase/formylglycine-generating enzyme family protein [Polyangia bacterium]